MTNTTTQMVPQPQIVPQQDPKKQNLTQGRSKENETFPYITKDR